MQRPCGTASLIPPRSPYGHMVRHCPCLLLLLTTPPRSLWKASRPSPRSSLRRCRMASLIWVPFSEMSCNVCSRWTCPACRTWTLAR
ncbi:hypothetical protein ATCV1_z472R [Acanthocystis turfacea chlorella virus 1]|uniref:Uncharacterized protein z472R n=1 Tax=Chlorovirus heliozoae TaxID=322019 RepID=A7K982_9PHYC|nr:hypothetical protein ATCV1_z472R [Acanthocystis turfacea chlorella virus 1]ABT16606.1 hypothetical protein ATCV1_z472R [Acanthocystis turfacea chlorella virus 1]